MHEKNKLLYTRRRFCLHSKNSSSTSGRNIADRRSPKTIKNPRGETVQQSVRFLRTFAEQSLFCCCFHLTVVSGHSTQIPASNNDPHLSFVGWGCSSSTPTECPSTTTILKTQFTGLVEEKITQMTILFWLFDSKRANGALLPIQRHASLMPYSAAASIMNRSHTNTIEMVPDINKEDCKYLLIFSSLLLYILKGLNNVAILWPLLFNQSISQSPVHSLFSKLQWQLFSLSFNAFHTPIFPSSMISS